MKVQDRSPQRLGPYRLIRRIGEGGMGVVYLATGTDGQPVAVKVLHPSMAQEENARRRLAREVETMRRVRSRYVAEVLDASLDGAEPYIVTRYVPGLTLDTVVGTAGPLTGQALARLASGLTQAMAAVHAAGVVHRDLKPGNVMICDGEPVVIDFGIAQVLETTRLTMTGMFMGTPGYLAPEVIEGKDAGQASDVHSLGATLVFASTGRPPFGSGAFEAVFYRIMHGQPDLDGLPVPLIPLVLSALARDPALRPAAVQLAAQLVAIDPATLIPGPPGVLRTLQGGGAWDVMARTVTEGASPAVPRESTQPLGAHGPQGPQGAADVLDLLPPVSYAPAGSPQRSGAAGNGRAAGAGFAAGGGNGWPPGSSQHSAALLPAPAGAGLDVAGAGSAGPGSAIDQDGAGSAWSRPASPVSAWSPLVFAVVAMGVAIAIMAPVIGTAIALAALLALRAVSTTVRQMGRRRSGDGPRRSDPVVAAALYPLALLRSLLGLLLLAPVALLGACVAVAATIIAVPVHPLPQGVALGAGVMVAIVGLGPGSGGSRMMLARLFGLVARSPGQRAIAYAGVLALAGWAGLTALSSWQTPAYWPVTSLHDQLAHLPTLRTLLTDVRQNLLRLARHFGL